MSSQIFSAFVQCTQVVITVMTLHTSRPDVRHLAGVQAELILGAIERKVRSAQPSNSSYLEQRVQYLHEDAQLVNPESQGVMMAWEGPLMQAHAKVAHPWS